MSIVAPNFQFGNWKYDPSAENSFNNRTKTYGPNPSERPLEHSQLFGQES
jgi:hypothetical protein